MSLVGGISIALGQEMLKAILDLTGIIKDQKKEVQPVKIIHVQDDFSQIRLGRITSSNTTFPKNPDKEFKNPLDRDVAIRLMSVVPDATFRTNGRLLIKINGAPVFEDDAVADWTDLEDLQIPLTPQNDKLKRNESIEFFITSSSGTSALTVTVTLGASFQEI